MLVEVQLEKRTGSIVGHQQTGRPRYLWETWPITLFILSPVVLLDLSPECLASTLPWTWLNVSFLSQLRFDVVIAWRIPQSRMTQPSSGQLIRTAEQDRTYLWEPPRYQEARLVEGTKPMLNKRRPPPEHHTTHHSPVPNSSPHKHPKDHSLLRQTKFIVPVAWGQMPPSRADSSSNTVRRYL